MKPPHSTIPHYGTRAAPETDSPDWPLRIAGVYSDLPAHTLATAVFRNITCNCASICTLHADWWSFESLEATSVRETAACVAADADMIWYATNAGERLPEAVRAWAHLWVAHRRYTGALVVLLGCPSDYPIEQSPAWTYFCWLAREARTDLFAQRFDSGWQGLTRLALQSHEETLLFNHRTLKGANVELKLETNNPLQTEREN